MAFIMTTPITRPIFIVIEMIILIFFKMVLNYSSSKKSLRNATLHVKKYGCFDISVIN